MHQDLFRAQLLQRGMCGHEYQFVELRRVWKHMQWKLRRRLVLSWRFAKLRQHVELWRVGFRGQLVARVATRLSKRDQCCP